MTTLLQRVRLGERLDDLDIIDMHGHLGRPPFGVPDLSPDAVVASMDRIGVRTIVCSHIHCICAGPTDANEQVLEAARAFPGRILGYVRLWPTDAETVRAETETYLNRGFVGLKLHNTNGFAYTDAAYAPALAMANERRMPALLHTWGLAHEFEQVRTLAACYPEVALLLGHSGASGAEAEYVQVAREFENVYLEVCMSLGPRGLIDRMVEGTGVEKVVWGSDALFLNQAQQLGKVIGSRLSDDLKRAVLSTNAQRLLGRIQR
ncbi:MAG: amidohydrolase [Planctomycetes bacterium]|nr:amidohydrolase [Planctomycetota bacterium]